MLTFYKIVFQIVILYLFFLLGEWIQQSLHLFIPGSVIGMIILFLLLLLNVVKLSWIDLGSKFIIRHLALLFIPVTVGVIEYLNLFKGDGLILVFIVIISTLLVMISSGLLSQWLVQRKEIKND
ncbi:CidA/LrgA family protein [Oceanobacillus chungangensis]|uniref:CidA/LrgA family protein n=1 Tax=Oceanobacillus chungangensis TaxID=1229152 RepID=A0A3D8PN50_9BACI|nr:CidA/LrgA family holin-like protein [Oceanobacillus chungangensis]RDW17404.1 CidA/LrgA family protein [Oceanobacillus chungangensis]